MAEEKPFENVHGLLTAKQWMELMHPALQPYNVSISTRARLDRTCVVPEAEEGTLRAIASSLQKGTVGMSSWSLADLTLGLYKVARRHIRENVVDMIDGCLVNSMEEFKEISRWLQWGLAAYSKDTQSLADALKVPKHHIILHVSASEILKPAFYIAVDNARKCVVMGIRGTQTASDFLTDLNHHCEEIDGGYAHSGMLTAARHFHDNEGQILRDLLAANHGYNLVLVGHSLGAGTAALLCMLLRGRIRAGSHHVRTSRFAHSKVICWGFGCPPCLDRRLATQTNYIKNVVLQDDVVPRLCASSLEGLRSEILETDWNQALDDGSKTKRMVDLVQSTYSTLQKVEPAIGLERGYLYDHAKKYGHATYVVARQGMVTSLVKAQDGIYGKAAKKVAKLISLGIPPTDGVLPADQDGGNLHAPPFGTGEATTDSKLRRLVVPGILYHILRKPLEHGGSLHSQHVIEKASKIEFTEYSDYFMTKTLISTFEQNKEGEQQNGASTSSTKKRWQYIVIRNDDPTSSFNRIVFSGTMLTDHSLYNYDEGIRGAMQFISSSTVTAHTLSQRLHS